MRSLLYLSLTMVLIGNSLASGLRVSLNSINQIKYPEIELDLTVFDSSGKALQNLQRKNIVPYENGAVINNYYMEISNDSVQIALVLDDSGSMHFNIGPLIKAVNKFISNLDRRDKVTILSFSDTVRSLSSFTSDKSKLTGALKNLKGYGATALYDAIYKAAEILSDSKKTAVVLLSDGIDQNRDNTGSISNKSAIDAVTLAVRKKIPIHTIGLGKRINRQELKDFARLSKGAFYYAPSAEQLSDLYTLIARNLKSDIKIKYISPNDKRDASFRNVELEVRFRNLSGRASGNYFTPGKFVLDTTGFGYNSKKSAMNRDDLIRFILSDENGIQKTGGKEFLQSWINQLGK